jgi:type I restriction enzyme, S subunit
MSFPRYPSYKDSGVEWLGDVPVHWEVKLVKNLASIVNGYPFDSVLFDAAEGFPLVRIRDLNKSEAETFYKGEFVETAAITSDDVLIGMDGDFNVGRWRGQGRALLNQRMCCVRGKSNVLTRLLEYSLPLRLKAINDVTYATTVKHLASSQVEKSFVAIPPDTTEQTKIAAFLDRETAKIDGLVAEQRRLMELLKEKRQAVISHAVTQGLNPHAPMKPSGIEWLGDVPVHWELKRLKYLGDAITGLTYSPSDIVEDDTSGTLVLRSSNVQRGVITFDDNVYVSAAIPEELVTQIGDILICSHNGSRALIGKNATIDETSSGLTFGAFMTVFRSKHSAYLSCVLNSPIGGFNSEVQLL